MNKKLKNFTYSQNSLNTYKVCPMKFKYKYIDNINWKYGEVENREYYEGLIKGKDFHLICERYFSKIPLGITSQDQKFYRWIEKIKNVLPIKDGNIYLPEYEVRYNLCGNNIQAKYDLVVIENNEINIWDWKTESKKMKHQNLESRMQTIVYMFLAKEVIPKIRGIEIKADKIKMNYYQPEFYDEPITISYSEEKHEMSRKKISKYIEMIQKTEFEQNKNIENKNNCKFCEFNKLCNGQEVDYKNLEEEINGA